MSATFFKTCKSLALHKLLATSMLGASLSMSGTASAADSVTIKLAHVLSEKHSWHEAALGLADTVAANTEGRVTIEVFPSGQLGSEKDVIEGLQIGSVQAGVVGSGSFQFVEPKMGVIEMPYAWNSRENAFQALDGSLGTALSDMLAAKNIVVLAWWENGYRHVTNNRGPIESPADLAELKIRVTPDKVRLETFEALGAQPAPLAFGELYSALQQGVFDAQENPLSIIHSASFFEVQKYASLTGHVWGAASLVVSSSIWNRISESDQAIVKAAAEEWRDKQRQMITDSDAELVSLLEAEGMSINEVDKAPFKQAVQSIWDSQREVFGDELFNIMDQYRQ